MFVCGGGGGSSPRVISALMDVSGGGEVAVSHPSAAGGFLSHPTRLLVPVFLSPVFSHLDLEETRWQMG